MLATPKKLLRPQGFGIIEMIVALGLFIVMAVTGATTVIGSFSTNRLGDEETEAAIIAQQGIEAARSIRDQGWTSVFLATNCSTGCGVNNVGSWAWSGSSNVLGDFTRIITISDVSRNVSGEIVNSGGTDDPDTKLITSTVAWDFTPLRNNTISFESYVTNFRKAITGNWASPTQQSSYNISGNDNGTRVQTAGNYAYVVRNIGTPNFAIINISNPATPTLSGSLTLSGNPTNIFISGAYAYVTNSSNTQELQVVDISNPASPSQVGSFNNASNQNATSVFVVGNVAYMTFDANNEFSAVNVSNPAAPVIHSQLNLPAIAKEVVVVGSYAYVANDNNTSEVIVINVSNPASLSQVGTLNLAGNVNADTISVTGSTLLIGQGTVFHTASISTPTTPTLVGSLTLGGTITDLGLDLANSDTTVFVSNSSDSTEFLTLSISNPATPSVLGSYNTTGTDNLNGVAYNVGLDRAVAVGDSNTQEFIVFQAL